MARNERFGTLLSEGIASVAGKQQKDVGQVEVDLAESLTYSHHTIQRWKRGYLPKETEHLAFLVRYCVQQGRVDQEWARSILTQSRYYDQGALIQELFPDHIPIPAMPSVSENLPPRYGDFLGREAAVEEVLKSLDSRWPLISIEGMGGVGKTTLAIEVARYCLVGEASRLEDPFEACVFVSARDRELTITDMLDTVAHVLNYPRIIQQVQSAEKPAEVDRLLRAHRVLLIVDNFETVTDAALVHYLQCIPEPSKAIITTRRGQLRRVWNIPLEGLPEPEALELIRRHAQRVRLPAVARAEPEMLNPLVDVTGGNPYAIETALGYLKYGGMGLDHLVIALYQAEQRVGTIFDYIFARAWNVLDQDAQQLLMVMPFFIDSASKDAIGTTAGVSSYYLDIALSQVVEMSLLMGNDALDETQKRYRVHPLTRAFAAAKLHEYPDWKQQARERWVQWYQAFATIAEDPANYAALEAEVNNLAGVVEWLITHENQAEAGQLLGQLQHFLYAQGYWKTYIDLAEQIAEWAIAHEDVNIIISLCQFVGGIVDKWGQTSSLQGWIPWLRDIANQVDNKLLQAEMLLTHARMLRRQGLIHREMKIDAAERSIQEATEALTLFRQHRKYDAEVAALNEIGNAYLARREFGEAEKHYHKALYILRQNENQIPRSNGWCSVLQGNLGIVRGRQGFYTEACEILEVVLQKLTEQTDIAEAYVVLSLYQFLLDNEEQARTLRRKADDLIERLGLARPICEEDQKWMDMEPSVH